MRLSKRQLRRIIKEELLRVTPVIRANRALAEAWASEQPYANLDPVEEYEPQDEAEYQRGYQDGFDAYPIADNATPDYDAGYEDGKLDADLPEVPYDEVRSEDW